MRVKNAQHHFFAKGGGQGGQTQLHLGPCRCFGFDAAVLRFAFFSDIHAAQAFQAADHCGRDLRRKVINAVQHAINAQAHGPLLAPGFDMDIAGPLFERVLKQPVNDMDDMGIVGIGFLIARAKVYQLLKVGQVGVFLIRECSPGDGFGQTEQFRSESGNLKGVGKYPLDGAIEGLAQIGLPPPHIGLRTGNGDRVLIGCNRKNLMTLRERAGHEPGDAGGIDFQGIEAHVGLPALLRKPSREVLKREGFAGAHQVG